ncbi:MAG TPA: PQQ-binding-like beta-propeller repeat protein [Gemmatimonadales bacterium]|nr:PQQ-binding-like beta-propeller repeat protein [Gemmatimonadales bacterium]
MKRLGLRKGVLSLAVLFGGVNAACINYRPAPVPLAREVAGAAPRELWNREVGRALSGRPALDVATPGDTTLYVGGYDRFLYAVALDSAGAPRWKRRLAGAVVGGALERGGSVYAATSAPDGRVYALNAGDGKTRWEQRAVKEISAPLTLADGLLLALDERGLVTALDTAAGKVRWRRLVGPGRAAPVADDAGHVVVASVDSLVRLDTRTGAVLARTATPGSVVAPLVPTGTGPDAVLLAASTDSLLVAFDPATLRVRWRARLDAPVTTPPLVFGDTVWAVSRIGTLYRVTPGAAHLATPGSVAAAPVAAGAAGGAAVGAEAGTGVGAATPAAAGVTDSTGGPAAAAGAPRELLAERVAALRWPVTAPLTALGDLLLLGGADGTVRALRHDGTEAWRLALWSPVEIAPVPVAGGFVAIGGNADIHRYAP